MDRLKQIEKNINKAGIFELLEYLKELAVLENKEEVIEKEEIRVVGLIERVQEKIVFSCV